MSEPMSGERLAEIIQASADGRYSASMITDAIRELERLGLGFKARAEKAEAEAAHLRALADERATEILRLADVADGLREALESVSDLALLPKEPAYVLRRVGEIARAALRVEESAALRVEEKKQVPGPPTPPPWKGPRPWDGT